MGAERRSHFVTEQNKRATAYHEGGHALVALHTPGAMPLHKVYVSAALLHSTLIRWQDYHASRSGFGYYFPASRGG